MSFQRFWIAVKEQMIRERGRLAGSRLTPLLPYVGILAAVYALYHKTLAFGFTSLDDHHLIRLNSAFLSDPASLIQAFKRTIFGFPGDQYYRPLLMLSFIADYFLGHNSVFFYHFSNIVYHVIACGFLYALLREMGNKREVAVGLSLLFAVHPVLSQAVAWIPGRNDSLMGIFVFSSFICYLRYMKSGSVVYLAGNGMLLFLGLLIKENVLPAITLFSFYHFLHREEHDSWFRIAAPWMIWMPVVAGWFHIRSTVIIEYAPDVWFSLVQNFVMQVIPGAGQYLGKIFFPYNLSVMPYIKDISPLPGIAAACLLLVLIAVSRPRRPALIMFGLAWFFFFIAPVMLHDRPELYEHRVYVPMAGILMILPEFSVLRKVRTSLLYGIGAAFFLLFTVCAFLNSENFRDPLVFTLNAAVTSPSIEKSHYMLADVCLEQGYVEAARKELHKALKIAPHDARANLLLGRINLHHDHDKRSARYRFFVSCAKNPSNDTAFGQLAYLHYTLGRYDMAKQYVLTAMRLNGTNMQYVALCYDLVDIIRQDKHLPPAPRPKMGYASRAVRY